MGYEGYLLVFLHPGFQFRTVKPPGCPQAFMRDVPWNRLTLKRLRMTTKEGCSLNQIHDIRLDCFE